jgi:D-alanyl-D-alanine carboxypeptidase
MLRAGARVGRGLRWGVFGLAAVLPLTAIATNADARGRHTRNRTTASSPAYQPSYSSIVVDANTGKTMEQTNADSPRHPASLTKIMTLYLLFERLESGKIKLTTEMPVSAHASEQAPSKLGLKPGETIKVETAIRAIVTKSANDVAVIVSEALGGDEASFAKMMTAKARALGMKGTTYYNASGLPNDQQYTTARDQAILGRAVHDRFPDYYRYFATRTFDFRGKSMRNHNHLLGAVTGVDGIKTGYIHDSGFNIVTSVTRGTRHIVAVVFGGTTANARDTRVRGLIESHVNVASTKQTSPPIVEGWDTAEANAKEAPKEAAEDAPRKNIKESVKEAVKEIAKEVREPVAAAAPLAAVASKVAETPAPGSTDPIKPNAVKTFTVRAGKVQTASLSPQPPDSRKLAPAPTANAASVTTVATIKSDTPQMPPLGAKPGVLGVLTTKVASAGETVPVPATASEPAVKSVEKPTEKPRAGGWIIQVGAFPDEKEAKSRLDAAQTKAKGQLGQAEAFTEKTTKGDKPLFRARFAGLEKDQAEVACKQLKRSEIPCMVLKN